MYYITWKSIVINISQVVGDQYLTFVDTMPAFYMVKIYLQCLDAVGWAAGRASSV